MDGEVVRISDFEGRARAPRRDDDPPAQVLSLRAMRFKREVRQRKSRRRMKSLLKPEDQPA